MLLSYFKFQKVESAVGEFQFDITEGFDRTRNSSPPIEPGREPAAALLDERKTRAVYPDSLKSAVRKSCSL
jgi:hypothetical protein